MKSSDRALLISRRQVIDLATPWDYLVAMERAFLELAHGGCTLPPVGHIACREGGFHIKAALGNAVAPRAVVKINGNFPGNAARHGLPTIQGFIALLDAERGTVLAFIESSEITARRTAATTALAARLLAREDSETLGIVGCGRQASCHVQALLDVVNIRTVKFCEPRDEPARQFRSFLDGTSVVGTRTADGASAARDADIVVTLTTSSQPILHMEDVAEGTFVAGVGADSPSKHELAPDLLQASRVVPDLLSQAEIMGDLHHAIQCGAMTRADVHGELGDVVAGNTPGRRKRAERFVFDSTGVAIQDLAAAEMLYERARAVADWPAIALDDVRSN